MFFNQSYLTAPVFLKIVSPHCWDYIPAQLTHGLPLKKIHYNRLLRVSFSNSYQRKCVPGRYWQSNLPPKTKTATPSLAVYKAMAKPGLSKCFLAPRCLADTVKSRECVKWTACFTQQWLSYFPPLTFRKLFGVPFSGPLTIIFFFFFFTIISPVESCLFWRSPRLQVFKHLRRGGVWKYDS